MPSKNDVGDNNSQLSIRAGMLMNSSIDHALTAYFSSSVYSISVFIGCKQRL